MADLLVVIDNITDVIATAVVRFADRHGVVREVDIAIFTVVSRHFGGRDANAVQKGRVCTAARSVVEDFEFERPETR